MVEYALVLWRSYNDIEVSFFSFIPLFLYSFIPICCFMYQHIFHLTPQTVFSQQACISKITRSWIHEWWPFICKCIVCTDHWGGWYKKVQFVMAQDLQSIMMHLFILIHLLPLLQLLCFFSLWIYLPTHQLAMLAMYNGTTLKVLAALNVW